MDTRVSKELEIKIRHNSSKNSNQSYNLVIFSSNVRSIKNKILEFNAYLKFEKIDIFMICETHLDNCITDQMITKFYTLYRKDRNTYGGGVMIGVKKNLNTYPLTEIQTNTFESISCLLIVNNNKYLLFCCYITTNPTPEQMSEFSKTMEFLDNNYSDYKLIFSGDLNINILNQNNMLTKNLNSILDSLKLYQLVSQPTYPSDLKYSLTPSLIDLFIINDKYLINDINITPNITEKCDHLAIIALMNVKRKPKYISEKARYILDLNEKVVNYL